MSSTSIDISFCLPVYNVKRFIEECINSIYTQGVDNFEIICVDDCSTDGSYEELLRLKELHPEIRVFQNEKNSGGCAQPRRIAFQNANGRYLWFVDPDDILVAGSGALYLKIADENNADAVLGRHFDFYDGSTPKVPETSGRIGKADFRDPKKYYRPTVVGAYSDSVVIGLFSKAFLDKHHICFRKELLLYEEYTFHFEVGIHSANIITVDHYGYLYRLRRDSVSHHNTQERFKRGYLGARGALEVFEGYRKNCDKEVEASVDAHIQMCKEAICIHLVRITDRKYVKHELRELREKGIHPYRNDPKLVYQPGNPKKNFVMRKILPSRLGFALVNLAFRMKDMVQSQKRES